MKPEILVVKVSLKKPIIEFGHWLVTKMDHSGLLLYLVLHPEEIDILSGARAIGLEVNLPKTVFHDVYRERREKKIDLIFKKEDTYYLVEVVDKKAPDSRDKEIIKEKAERFKENWQKAHVIPWGILLLESPQQALLSLLAR